jgi:heat shock transcription factor 2
VNGVAHAAFLLVSHLCLLDSQQLNFYSFRKIKYADTIRIDPQLEAETANYWRFRHEKFQKGKPELLIEIKRMTGQKAMNKSTTAESISPDQQPSSSLQQPHQQYPKAEKDNELKSEVNSLKKRIEAMTKNIDELTSLVEKVSLKQEQVTTEDMVLSTGNKRKKAEIRPDEMLSSSPTNCCDFMDLEQDLDSLAAMTPPPVSPPRDVASDDEFVDQLFNAFGNEDEALLWDDPLVEPIPELTGNMPDPELMKRLSDALSLLPREIQELIVDRLIAAITSTDPSFDAGFGAASALTDAAMKADVVPSMAVTPTPRPSTSKAPNEVPASPQHERPVTLPMAAATLAALVAHYSSKTSPKNTNKNHNVQKSLPVIPVHA